MSETALVTAVRLLRKDAPRDIVGAPQGWARWDVLLPHVLAVAEHATGPSDDPPVDPPVDADLAWLLDRAGTYLQVQGLATQGRALLERALAIVEDVHGPGHRVVGAVLNNLATLLRVLDELDTARPLAERALRIAETVLPQGHPDIAGG